jgi:hypothetical protein
MFKVDKSDHTSKPSLMKGEYKLTGALGSISISHSESLIPTPPDVRQESHLAHRK